MLINKIPNNNLRILEIAVGTAKNSVLLAKDKPNLKITGIDLSKEMLDIARKDIEKNNISNIELLKMDATNMTFENETFDGIIVSLLLHEMTEDLSHKVLTECLRVLKNNGKIYVLEWEKPKKIFEKILFLGVTIFEPREFKIFMEKDLNVYFSKNGLQISDIEYGDYSKVIELLKSVTNT
jgi:ubiquinone/menaquinone biosynthesis C-methylase UbiE